MKTLVVPWQRHIKEKKSLFELRVPFWCVCQLHGLGEDIPGGGNAFEKQRDMSNLWFTEIGAVGIPTMGNIK